MLTDKQINLWKKYRKARRRACVLSELLDNAGIDPHSSVCYYCGGPCSDLYEDGVFHCSICKQKVTR